MEWTREHRADERDSQPTQEFDPEGVSFEAFIRFLVRSFSFAEINDRPDSLSAQVDRNEDRHSVEKVRSCFRDAGQDKVCLLHPLLGAS